MEKDFSPLTRSRGTMAEKELGEDILRLLWEDEIHAGYGDSKPPTPTTREATPYLPIVGPTTIEGDVSGGVNDAY